MREAMVMFYTGTMNFSLRDVREVTGHDGLTQVNLLLPRLAVLHHNRNKSIFNKIKLSKY